jgi:dihydrofolate reductase
MWATLTMPRLTVFNQVSLDGFIADARGDMSWAHRQDPEWKAFTAQNSKNDSRLIFGRITYEMMAGFWPTPEAMRSIPDVAERMNGLPKVVFSRTLTQAGWNNTRLLKGDLAAEVLNMKNASGPDLVIMGSGSIVSQLAREGLVDRFLIVVNPVVLGKGKSMFEDVSERLNMRLTDTRTFRNGNILLSYEPAE